MSNNEILEKAIQKAIDGGWVWPWDKDYLWFNFAGDDNDLELWNGGEYEDATTLHSYAVIFNHDFAKALWGEEPYEHASDGEAVYDKNGELRGMNVFHQYNWAKHLQQMVMAEDPIKYLGENI